MSNSSRRGLNQQAAEEIRRQAVSRALSGEHPEAVAAYYGLHRKTVYGWLARYREGGQDSLRARPTPGRPSKLTMEQVARLQTMIVGGDPRQLSLDSALWTHDLVRQLIDIEFDASLSAVSVGRVLRKSGLLVRHDLLRRASQRNPDAAAIWKTATYPRIRAAARQAGATVYFVDISSSNSSTTTISATAAQHPLRFSAYVSTKGEISTANFVDFCLRIQYDAASPVYLVIDDHPPGETELAIDSMIPTNGELRLYSLPQ